MRSEQKERIARSGNHLGTRRPAVALCVLAAAALFPLFRAWHRAYGEYTFDDAFIAYRVMQHWASGEGLLWNHGADAVEAFTSFAWVALGSVLTALTGLNPEQTMPIAGAGLLAAALGVVVPLTISRLARVRPCGSVTWIPALACLTALLINPYIGFHAFHGLETSAAILCYALICLWIACEPSTRNNALLALTCMVAFMTRPDTPGFFLPVWIAHWALMPIARTRRDIRRAFAVLLLAMAVYTAIKWLYFGYPLPNTVYVKRGHLLSGLPYVKAFIKCLSPLALYGIILACLVGPCRLLSDRKFVALIGGSCLFGLAYIKLQTTIGHGFRFLIVLLAPVMLGTLRGCIIHIRSCMERKRSTTVPLLLYTVAVVLTTYGCLTKAQREQRAWDIYFDVIRNVHVEVGKQLAPAAGLSPQPLLATGDIGAIPYYTDLPALDLVGLADETVAHHGLSVEYLSERKPDIFILQKLWLRPSGETATNGMLLIDGELRAIDEALYARVVSNRDRGNWGSRSSHLVVTMPGFTNDYAWVAHWTLERWHDSFHVFIRNAYPRQEKLRQMLQTVLIGPARRIPPQHHRPSNAEDRLERHAR